MKRKLCVFFLGFALFAVPLRPVVGQSPSGQASRLDIEIGKIKAAISKRVTDDKTHVKIKLRDGSEVRGPAQSGG